MVREMMGMECLQSANNQSLLLETGVICVVTWKLRGFEEIRAPIRFDKEHWVVCGGAAQVRMTSTKIKTVCICSGYFACFNKRRIVLVSPSRAAQMWHMNVVDSIVENLSTCSVKVNFMQLMFGNSSMWLWILCEWYLILLFMSWFPL